MKELLAHPFVLFCFILTGTIILSLAGSKIKQILDKLVCVYRNPWNIQKMNIQETEWLIERLNNHKVKLLGNTRAIINAAVRNHSSVETSDIAEWNRLLSVNVLGAVNFCKAALPALRNSGNASIVNVSSCYAVVGRSGMPIYDATKAALLSVTRTLAFEEAQNGVRANAVCPGGTLTPFTIGRGVASGRNAEEMQNDQRSDSLLRRWGRPEEIAYPVLWLASDESSYMTGATIMVDGGLSIM